MSIWLTCLPNARYTLLMIAMLTFGICARSLSLLAQRLSRATTTGLSGEKERRYGNKQRRRRGLAAPAS
jgi:hypothetical protein